MAIENHPPNNKQRTVYRQGSSANFKERSGTLDYRNATFNCR
jgi:hypothetical protein